MNNTRKGENKRYYEKNKKRILQDSKQYYITHKEEKKEWRDNYYLKNKAKILRHQKIYAKNHKKEKSIYGKKYQKNNKLKINEKNNLYYQKRKHILQGLKINGCAICGYGKNYAALEFHHVNPRDKNYGININTVVKKSITKELNKCILLCANCHREIHHRGLTK